MSDPAFVAAAYAVVLGGLAAYVITIGRRSNSGRRTADALERHRMRDRTGPPEGEVGEAPVAGRPSEAHR